MFFIALSNCVNRKLLSAILESYFESLVCCKNPMCDLLDFEMRLWKSITNRKSSVDVKRGIRCDGLTGFMHRVRKSDVWSDNAHFIFVQIRCGAAYLPGV